MNASKFILAGILSLGAAFASAATSDANLPKVKVTAPSSESSGEGYIGYTGFVSTKTRAQVIQELVEARRRGEIYDGEAYPGPFTTPSNKTRAEVMAELKDHRRNVPDAQFEGALVR